MATSASTGLIGVVRSTFRKLNAIAEAMDRTPYDDLADREVSRLEQELTQLKKEGRRVDAA
jgi:hypothetical protein